MLTKLAVHPYYSKETELLQRTTELKCGQLAEEEEDEKCLLLSDVRHLGSLYTRWSSVCSQSRARAWNQSTNHGTAMAHTYLHRRLKAEQT